MKQLTAGKTGPLKAAPAKAVHALMRKRVAEGKVERPDPTPGKSASGAKVKVKVSAKVSAFLQQRKKPAVQG